MDTSYPGPVVEPPLDFEYIEYEGEEPAIDENHIYKQIRWSTDTFGPGEHTEGVVDHIRKELNEILEDPLDVSEWADVIILAIDGAWRVGFTPADIIYAVKSKQLQNQSREWPDWRTAEPGKAIEHVR